MLFRLIICEGLINLISKFKILGDEPCKSGRGNTGVKITDYRDRFWLAVGICYRQTRGLQRLPTFLGNQKVETLAYAAGPSRCGVARMRGLQRIPSGNSKFAKTGNSEISKF
eukprot:sb/3477081/